MVLKFDSDPGEVYLVESTGGSGVALNKWSFLRSHIGVTRKFYKKCVFRHVNFKRDSKMLENLESFLKSVIGLKYALKPLEILRRNNKAKDEHPNENSTFFCSSLIAKAYKLLGVIENDDTPCQRFFPHHFSSSGDKSLKLTEGSRMEEELQLILETDDMLM
eukprot:CAMPEP_0170484486 /NCGR_PEP_ID=MMETSP0208-20121228/3945_1 /TAXON_ID=197538 /ORGANISM="Strombidium inclinatum, Strain S3" /LENGTH=161 /DNA_ID=CAMNT_0010757827 /DNA_START=1451 /DNA_END=1936 /DNA_ORIENTATION=+